MAAARASSGFFSPTTRLPVVTAETRGVMLGSWETIFYCAGTVTDSGLGGSCASGCNQSIRSRRRRQTVYLLPKSARTAKGGGPAARTIPFDVMGGTTRHLLSLFDISVCNEMMQHIR
jgi:hypothetical protein